MTCDEADGDDKGSDPAAAEEGEAPFTPMEEKRRIPEEAEGGE